MQTDPCPACGVQPQMQAYVPWGDGKQSLAVVPWLCAACGALAILNLSTGRLTATTEAEWEPVRQKNPVLWMAIMEARALVRASLEDGDAPTQS